MKRILLAVVLVAFISAFLNPDLGPTAEGLAIFLGFLIAIGVVLITFELPGLLVHRRSPAKQGGCGSSPGPFSWRRPSSSCPGSGNSSRATSTASSWASS